MSGGIVLTGSAAVIPNPNGQGPPGGPGAAGAPGGNVMSVGLAKDMGTVAIPAGANLVRTSGNESIGYGVADYFKDAAITAGYLVTFPKAGFRDSGGNGYRVLSEERLNSRAFYEATDPDYTNAMIRAAAYLKDIAANDWTNFSKGSQILFTPPDLYLMSAPVDFTHQLIVEGVSTLHGNGTKFSWTVDCDGFRTQSGNTTGASGVLGSPSYSGSYVTFRNLGVCGPYEDQTDFTGNVESESHAFNMRANYVIENCHADGWAGDGLHDVTSVGGGGAEEGNSNCSSVSLFRVTNVRNGAFIDGADGNAGAFRQIIATYCRRWAVWDSSFLSNTHTAHHSSNAGMIPGVIPTQTTYGGNRYSVVSGQEVGAKTNAPSGTTADNQWWYYLGAGGAASWLNIAAWVSGATDYRAGGSYHTDSLNGYGSFRGCYSEGGEGVPQFMMPTAIYSGLWGTRDPVFMAAGGEGNRYAGNTFSLMSGGRAGRLVVANNSNTIAQLTSHNNGLLTAGAFAWFALAQGYEADGVTPFKLGGIRAWPTTGVTTTAAGVVWFWTRNAGGTTTDWLELNGPNANLIPLADNGFDVGSGAKRIKTYFGYIGDFTTQVNVNGNKVLGSRGAALPADATDLPTAIALANAIKARGKVTGGHGLWAD